MFPVAALPPTARYLVTLAGLVGIAGLLFWPYCLSVFVLTMNAKDGDAFTRFPAFGGAHKEMSDKV